MKLRSRRQGGAGGGQCSSFKGKLEQLQTIYDEISEKNALANRILKAFATGEVVANAGDEFAAAIDVSYTTGPPRILSMELPARLMTLKELRVLNQRSWESRFEQYILARDTWEAMVACAVQTGQKKGGYEHLERFEKALTIITVFEKPGQKHDVDNFSISFLHNALVRTGVLADDSFFKLKYLVRGVCMPHKKSQEKTKVTVIDEENAYIYCQNCKLREHLG